LNQLIKKYLAEGENSWMDIADRVSGIMPYVHDRGEVLQTLAHKQFIPNSPTLISAGVGGGRNLMACHVIHVGDSISEILEAADIAAKVFKSGGGIGFEMSDISPRGSQLHYSPTGRASGPVSFMKIYNVLASVILEGGLRRAAMMATLNVKHPDILEFITCKEKDGELSNFNISVTLEEGPGAVKDKVWNQLCRSAYNNGEPGIVFLDHINKSNPCLGELGPIKAVNACSEQPLYNWGSCCLGHVVLPNVIQKLGDYGELKRVVEIAIKFLDRVVDVNPYPIHQFAQVARKIRNVGLGVMGWSNLLEANKIPFASQYANQLAGEIGEVIYTTAQQTSKDLGNGTQKNSFLTTIAPTGHTSRLAGVENSIYPTYTVGMGMTSEEHLDHVAAWQPWIDSAISYTISFANDAPESIVDRIYKGAYERKIKVMSVYRDGSRVGQPCNIEGDCG
jgi:ribonucleoside-diphosphate reductase alpha chain